jgi:predicted permease
MLPTLRQAWRALRRAPAFTFAAVLCLALGVGATTTVLAVADAVLLRPLAVRGLERMVVVRQDLTKLDLSDANLDAPGTEEVFARRDVFEAGAGVETRELNLSGEGREPERVRTARTLGDWFGMMGTTAARGRLYAADASRDPARHQTVVLSHAFWRRHFGGDPAVVGRSVRLNGRPFEVVGVADAALRYPRGVDLFVPFPVDSAFAQQRGRLGMTAIGRVRPDVVPARLDAALAAVAAQWAAASGGGNAITSGLAVRAVPFRTYLAGELRPITRVLLGAVLLVLLVACANVACLQLVRATGRMRELAVRAAVGARAPDLARPLVADSVLLAALGGAAGVALAALSLAALRHWGPARYPQLAEAHVDPRVLAGALAATVGSALAFGLAPLVHALRVDPQAALRGGSRGASATAGRVAFLRGAVVTQVALALTLALGAALLGRSFARLAAVDPGFRPEQVLSAQFALPRAGYPEPAQRLAAYDDVLERLQGTPGVRVAALSAGLPFGNEYDSTPFTIPGRAAVPGGPQPHAVYNIVSEDWFRALGVSLLRGRTFTRADDANAPEVVVVDEQLAREFFPGQDAVGRRLKQLNDAEIVGVVRRVARAQLGEAPKAVVYYPLRQTPWAPQVSAVVRGELPPASAERAVRAAVAAVDRQVPVYDVRPMAERVAESVSGRRLAVLSLGAFAGVALVLAALGLYGVLSYVVAQRTRELGVRAALGARAGQLERQVLGGGAGLAAVGVALGLLLFLATRRLLAALLFGVGAADPVALLGGSAVLAAAVLLASWIPARRAARVDPATALRAE